MQYRKIKKTDAELSLLSLGCMRFPKDEKAVDALVGRAIELGINYFDTAYIYPGNEAALGNALLNGRRKGVNIATKLPPYLVSKKSDFDKLFDKQRNRLKTDYIDYYLIHALSSFSEWQRLISLGVQEWLQSKKDAGEIGNIGFSFHGGTAQFKAIVDAYPWTFAMIQYNYLDEHRQAGREGLLYANSKDISMMIMEPLFGGKLANRLPPEAKKIMNAAEKDYTPAQWGLKWLFSQPQVTTVLSGMNDLNMLEENAKTARESRVGELTQKDEEMLKAVREAIMREQFVACTGCGYCMPCPQGVDIPLCFSIMNDIGLIPKAQAHVNYMVRVGKSKASLCTQCGKCEKHCPQGIQIRSALKSTVKTMEGFPYSALSAIINKFMRRS